MPPQRARLCARTDKIQDCWALIHIHEGRHPQMSRKPRRHLTQAILTSILLVQYAHYKIRRGSSSDSSGPRRRSCRWASGEAGGSSASSADSQCYVSVPSLSLLTCRMGGKEGWEFLYYLASFHDLMARAPHSQGKDEEIWGFDPKLHQHCIKLHQQNCILHGWNSRVRRGGSSMSRLGVLTM